MWWAFPAGALALGTIGCVPNPYIEVRETEPQPGQLPVSYASFGAVDTLADADRLVKQGMEEVGFTDVRVPEDEFGAFNESPLSRREGMLVYHATTYHGRPVEVMVIVNRELDEFDTGTLDSPGSRIPGSMRVSLRDLHGAIEDDGLGRRVAMEDLAAAIDYLMRGTSEARARLDSRRPNLQHREPRMPVVVPRVPAQPRW